MKRIFTTTIAILLAFIIANGICFVYYLTPNSYQLANNGVGWSYGPNTKYIQFYEGGAITQFDQKGNSNKDLPLADNYVLLLGSSHQEGIHVSDANKASYLLNNKLSNGDENHLYVYNAAKAGHFFPDQVKGFKAFLTEYTEPSIVVIEYYQASSLQNLKDAINQTNYNSDNCLANVVESEGTVSKFKNKVKNIFPLVYLLKNKQLCNASLDFSDAFGVKKKDSELVEVDQEEYFMVMNQVFSLLRKEYDGPIIMLYHPDIEIKDSGELELVYSSPEFEALTQGCIKYGFYLCDLGPAFMDDYNVNKHVPYGFSNSVLGEGHLNKYGHIIEANELYRVIQEEVER